MPIRRLLPALLAALLLPATAGATSVARDENFSVYADTPELAAEVLARANHYRDAIALEWFGRKMETGRGGAIIQLKLNESLETGLTSAPADTRTGRYMVWIEGPRNQVLDSALPHEMVHVLFCTHYSKRLPLWIEEGAASLYDDQGRSARQRERWIGRLRSDAWPDVARVLAVREIRAIEPEEYDEAAALTRYLLSTFRGDKTAFLRLAEAIRDSEPDAALARHCQVADTRQFQRDWENWARSGFSGPAERYPALAAAPTAPFDSTSATNAPSGVRVVQLAPSTVVLQVPLPANAERHRCRPSSDLPRRP